MSNDKSFPVLITDLLRFEVYSKVLKDSRLNKTMKRATTVCAAKCFIPNIVDLVEVYGRLCSLCSVLEMFYRTTQKDIGKAKSFL